MIFENPHHMKKHCTILILLSFLFAVSCIEEQSQESFEHNFHAQMEEFGTQVKTSLGERNSIVWSYGDCISIFAGSTRADQYTVYESSVGTPNGEFYLNRDYYYDGFYSGNELNTNIAVYPHSSALACYGQGLSDDTASYMVSGVSFPDWQFFSYDSFPQNSFVMMAVTNGTEDRNLKFKNVCGAFKLQLCGTGKIRSITLQGNLGEPLAGSAYITGGQGMTPYVEFRDGYSTSVTLYCGDGVYLNEHVPTSFIMALPPVYFDQGFTVSIEDVVGNIHTLQTSHPNEVMRSSILTMPEVWVALSDDVDNVTIAEALERRDIVKITGTVKATSSRGVILSDETATALVYYGPSFDESISIGDNITVTGNMKIYNYGYEFIPNETSINDHLAFEYEEAVTLDNNYINDYRVCVFDEGLPAIPSELIEFEGYLINQKYLRLSDSDEIINLYLPNREFSEMIPSLRYQKVMLRGYTFGLADSTYPLVLPVHIEVIGNEMGNLEEAMGSYAATFTGTVAAVSRKGYVLANDEGCMQIFYGTDYFSQYAIGDQVTAKGIVKTFDYGSEIFHFHDEYISYDEDFVFPTPEILTAEAIDNYVTSTHGLTPYKDNVIPNTYVQVTGTLMIEGTAYNIYVDGTPYAVNIFTPDSNTQMLAAEMAGQHVVLTGYTIKLTGGNKLGVVFSSMELA